MKGAFAAYAAVEKLDPLSSKNLLKAHGMMTAGLVDNLGKWNPLFYAAPVENMVLCHQRQYYRALHKSQVTGDAAPFVEFMLDVILRTIKARGVPKSATGGKKSGKKGGKKTEDHILDLLVRNPKLTFVGMVEALGISRSAIQKHVERLKDAQRLRRIGPDKGGHWEVVK